MKSKTITLTFDSGGVEWQFELPAGSLRPLSDLLAAHHSPLNTRCGRRGLCHGCEVQLQSGSLRVMGQEIHAPATVKSCLAIPMSHARILIPARSRIEADTTVSGSFRILVPHEHQPGYSVDGDCDVGVAIDIGTTTVALMLVCLRTGEVLASAGGLNAQVKFGDNVLTRIDAASMPGQLERMQHAVIAETLLPLLERACSKAGFATDRIRAICVAGNTTMLHILTGTDPVSLGRAPFTPVFIDAKRFTANELGFQVGGMNPQTPVQLLPGISGFVGADITAGIHASGMRYDPAPSLLVDIGTNGEMAIQADGRLHACATAAGPAFEGGGLRCGSRARAGAVASVKLSLDPFALDVSTVGGGPPTGGICGSAYIDFLAQARQSGLLTDAGRFSETSWRIIPEKFRHEVDGVRGVYLTEPGGERPFVTEVDIALVLQAKAAIGAGVETLLGLAGVAAAEIHRLYLCGGFGMHLDVAHAVAIGLLPGFRPDQVVVLGNTSLAGALLALTDRIALPEMETIGAETTTYELNQTDGFEDLYIDHLTFPSSC